MFGKDTVISYIFVISKISSLKEVSHTPILVPKRRYVESKHLGLSKLCLLVFLEIHGSAEKFGFLETKQGQKVSLYFQKRGKKGKKFKK